MPSRDAATSGYDIGTWACLALVLTPWLTALGLAGITPVLPRIEQQFATTPGAEVIVRLLVSAVGGAAIIGAPVAGFLAERFGPQRVLVWSLVLFASAGALGGILENLWLIFSTRLLLGLTVGAISVMGIAIITTRVAERQRNRWIGWYTLSGTVGAFIIISSAGYIGMTSWRAVFALHLLAVPILALVLVLITPEFERRADRDASSRESGVPIVWIFLAIGCGIVGGTVGLFLPFHLASLGEAGPDRIAIAMLPVNVFMGGTSMFYGAIRNRLDVVSVFLISFLIGAAGIATIVVATGLVGVLVGTSLCGAGMGLMTPNLFGAAAASVEPTQRARLIGFVRGGFLGGPLLAQLPLEPIAATFGPATSLGTLAAFTVAMAGAVIVVRAAIRPTVPAQPA